MNVDGSILEGFGVSSEDVDSFASSNVGLYGVDVARMSSYLLVQMASAWKYRTMSTFAVTDVIQALEGVRSRATSQRPRAFKGSVLSGLWKMHFIDQRFIVRNIYNEWGMFSEQSRKFTELCNRVGAVEEREPSPDRWPGRLAHEFVVGGYESRARKRKLTGEWLIFGIHKQKNIYLALCKHSSGIEEDREIYDALKRLCSPEFPEIFAADAQPVVSPDGFATR